MRRYAKLVLAVFLLGLIPMMTGAVSRSYVAGRYALELDDTVVGFLSSADGGNPVADVITEQIGSDGVARKHIAGVKYEDISVSFGTGMSQVFFDWIKSSLDGNPQRKSGSIIFLDNNSQETGRLTFRNALITEIDLPALDASSKDAAKMTIKFKPEVARQVDGDGSRITIPGSGVKQKQWLPANFRLRIDGLDSAMSRVNKIEAITIKQKIVENPVGDLGLTELEPAGLELPNLVFSTTESTSKALTDWRDAFMIQGNNGEDQEKTGTLEYLASDMKTVLFRLTLGNLGIYRLAPDKLESNSVQIRRVKAEMYMESLQFDYMDAATGGTPIPA